MKPMPPGGEFLRSYREPDQLRMKCDGMASFARRRRVGAALSVHIQRRSTLQSAAATAAVHSSGWRWATVFLSAAAGASRFGWPLLWQRSVTVTSVLSGGCPSPLL